MVQAEREVEHRGAFQHGPQFVPHACKTVVHGTGLQGVAGGQPEPAASKYPVAVHKRHDLTEPCVFHLLAVDLKATLFALYRLYDAAPVQLLQHLGGERHGRTGGLSNVLYACPFALQ